MKFFIVFFLCALFAIIESSPVSTEDESELSSATSGRPLVAGLKKQPGLGQVNKLTPGSVYQNKNRGLKKNSYCKNNSLNKRSSPLRQARGLKPVKA